MSRVSREMLLPNTVPVRSIDDLTPYHFATDDDGKRVLRKGAPPQVVTLAAADFASGTTTLNEFLDRVGVKK